MEGLVTHDRENSKQPIGKTLAVILNNLESLGYQVNWSVLNSKNFGLAQERKRIYIVGTKKEKISLDGFNESHAVMEDILEKGKPTIDSEFTRLLMSHFTPEQLYGKSIKDKRGGDDNIHSWDIEMKGPVSEEQKQLLNMILRERRKKKWALIHGIKWMDGMPLTIEMIKEFYHNDNLKSILEDLVEKLSGGDVAGVLVPGINRYGIIEDLSGYADAVHAAGALLAVYSDPSSLAVLKTPGEWGADIACGDAQTLGIPLSFGGPYAGFLACRKDLMRKLPGRIVGATTDADGKRSFVLTLQAREQHIRREKATSNICSNQSLMALFVTVYLSLMGPDGLRKVNDLSYGGAHYLHDRLLATGKFTDAFDKPFLKEFVMKTSLDIPALQQALMDAGFFAALQTEEGYVSFCVTERRTREEIDALVDVIDK